MAGSRARSVLGLEGPLRNLSPNRASFGSSKPPPQGGSEPRPRASRPPAVIPLWHAALMKLDIPDSTMARIREAQALAAAGDVAGAVVRYRALLSEVEDDDYQGAAIAHMFALIVDDPL